MSLIPLKVLLFALAIITLLLFSTGIVAFRKDTYQCLGAWDYGFRERVEIVHLGFLHIYAYPLTRECPEELQYNSEGFIKAKLEK